MSADADAARYPVMEVFLGKAKIVRVDTSTTPHQLQLSTEGWQSSVSFDAINESLSAFCKLQLRF